MDIFSLLPSFIETNKNKFYIIEKELRDYEQYYNFVDEYDYENDEDHIKLFRDYSVTKINYLSYIHKNDEFYYKLCDKYASVDTMIFLDKKPIVDFSKNNNYNLCRDLYDILQIKCNRKTFNEAIKDKNSDLYQWIQNNKDNWEDIYFGEIIDTGYLELCQAIYDEENHYDCDDGCSEICDDGFVFNAIEINSLEICKWLYDLNWDQRDKDIFIFAIKNGSLEICKWLYENRLFGDIENLLILAVETKSLDFCKLILEEYEECEKKNINQELFYKAIELKCLDICKWLLNIDCYFELKTLIKKAILSNSLEICDWVYNINPSYYDKIFIKEKLLSFAISYGYDIKICQWLYEKGCRDLNKNMFFKAIDRNSLEICQWLYEKGFGIINYNSFEKAIECVSLKILKWLHSIKCPYRLNDDDIEYAIKLGNYDFCKWLFSIGYRVDKSILYEVISDHPLFFCKWLYKNGYYEEIKDNILNFAIEKKNLKLCQWLIKNGCSWDKKSFRSGILSNSLKICKWLIENGCSCYKKDLKFAQKNNLDIYVWICKNKIKILTK